MDPRLAGRWRGVFGGKPQDLEIEPSGKARLLGAPYLLVVVGAELIVPQFGASYPFELQGETLTVEIDGQPLTFSRSPA